MLTPLCLPNKCSLQGEKDRAGGKVAAQCHKGIALSLLFAFCILFNKVCPAKEIQIKGNNGLSCR
jgi:hypothetical protein